MAYALLEVIVNSARSLEDVRVLGDMKVYIVVSLSTEPQTTQKSHVDIHGETNPSWNFKMKFFFDALNLRNPNFELVFELKCQRSFGGDKGVGEVRVPVRDLLVRAQSQLGSVHVVTFPVTGHEGRRKGSLTFSYLFARAGLMPGVPAQQVPILESDYAKLMMLQQNQQQSNYAQNLQGLGVGISAASLAVDLNDGSAGSGLTDADVVNEDSLSFVDAIVSLFAG